MSWFRRHLSWLVSVALWLGVLQTLVASIAAASVIGLDTALARELTVICSSSAAGKSFPPGAPAAPSSHDRLGCFLHCAAPLAAAPLAEAITALPPPSRITVPAAFTPRRAPFTPPRFALAGLGSRAPPLS